MWGLLAFAARTSRAARAADDRRQQLHAPATALQQPTARVHDAPPVLRAQHHSQVTKGGQNGRKGLYIGASHRRMIREDSFEERVLNRRPPTCASWRRRSFPTHAPTNATRKAWSGLYVSPAKPCGGGCISGATQRRIHKLTHTHQAAQLPGFEAFQAIL
jgi:hypothetical protein